MTPTMSRYGVTASHRDEAAAAFAQGDEQRRYEIAGTFATEVLGDNGIRGHALTFGCGRP